MRVFVAGGTGAIGRYLIPALIADGHHVTASTRSAGKSADLAAAGAVPVVMDGLDRDAVLASVQKAAPEVIVHQMTSLGITKDFRKFDQEFAVTNKLRTRGTDYLLEAARLAGSAGSSHRALPASRMSTPEHWSRPRTTPSIQTRRPPPGRRWRRSGMSMRRCRTGCRKGSCSVTACSTGTARRTAR